MLTAACTSADGGTTGDEDGVHVVAAFSPLEFIAHRVGGEAISVSSLTTDGVDPHGLELSPAQVADLDGADLVIYLSGMQAATDEAIAMIDPEHVVDTAFAARADLPGEGSGAPQVSEEDPHFWLDPFRLALAAQNVAEELSALDPDGAAGYTARAEELQAELTELDAEFSAGLAGCGGATLVTSHEAFGYLADRYDLVQVGIAGVDPDVEPSPARLREVSVVITETDVQTIYFEAMASSRVVEVLADELGLTADVLDPMERGTGADYLEVMRDNLEALERGLACTD